MKRILVSGIAVLLINIVSVIQAGATQYTYNYNAVIDSISDPYGICPLRLGDVVQISFGYDTDTTDRFWSSSQASNHRITDFVYEGKVGQSILFSFDQWITYSQDGCLVVSAEGCGEPWCVFQGGAPGE